MTLVTVSEDSSKKILCLMNVCPWDLLLSHEPTLWFELQFINRTIFVDHKVPQSLWTVLFDLEVHLVAVCKLSDSPEMSLSVQFRIHASSSIFVCPVWHICMMPVVFLMCATSASERVLAESIQIISRSPGMIFRWLCRRTEAVPLSSLCNSQGPTCC